ncbi:hypothetical protein WI697_26410 [Tistrella mobilis]|uniref:hypothetical protein n=2 Tax=Tistrella mobilis TaxID=171437 RepID=UPI0031F6D0F5
MWWLKFLVCVAIDLFDMTVGRLLFGVPFAGEAIGCAIGYAMFGKIALFYAVEGLDFTEQIDGFVPTATLIALAARARERALLEAAETPPTTMPS